MKVNEMVKKTVGIIGGLGPMATAYFMMLLTKYTDVEKEQDHIDSIIINRSSTPDRTAFILGQSDDNPVFSMIKDAKMLEKMNCDFLVMPCNTAHFVYEDIQKEVNIELINIVNETVNYTIKKFPGIKKIGLMATSGTIYSEIYQKAFQEKGIDTILPSETIQKDIMQLIYNGVKKGNPINVDIMKKIIESFYTDNCQAIILGCTELSIINTDYCFNDDKIIDSLMVLVEKTIEKAGNKFKR